MGWGNEPHEGFAEQRRDDGRWTGQLVADAVAQRAACSCGWRGETVHPAPAAPALNSPEWAAYEAEAERIDALIYAEWRAEHYAAILGYDPAQLLILGRDAGGLRHFLDGRPVHAGTTLELLLPGGRWQPVSYEWSWEREEPPTATLRLGAPAAA